MATVEFQKDVGGFLDGKGHWYSVRLLSTQYVVVRVQLDPLTHRHVPVATLQHPWIPCGSVDRCT